MSYLSLSFAAFVAVLLVLYYLLPAKWRVGVLLVASIGFYACFDLRYLLFLLIAAVSTFLCARFLPRLKKKGLWIGACITLNAGIWFAIKELPWLLITASRLFEKVGLPALPVLSWLVPVGLSYFTLQAIGYLVDVAKGRIQAETNVFRYVLFLSWFPAIVQGPISRYEQLMPQLQNTKRFSFETMRSNLLLILFGLVKKMVIADRLGLFVNTCFGKFSELHGAILYLAAVGYAIQLYADFSGCVDLCRGVSGLFGVDLVRNFDRPYLARSIKEFWGRWHISLSTWLKNYIYIPLGGNRKGTMRKYGNIFATFMVSGLWHGAGFNFFLWGGLHAVYQIIGQATLPLRNKVKALIGVKEGSLSERIYQTVITFHLVTFAWIIFRAGGLMTGLSYIKNMLVSADLWVLFNGDLFKFGLSQNYLVLLLVHIVALFAIEMCTKSQQHAIEGIQRQHLVLRWAIYLVLIFDVLLFGVYGSGYDMASFMYGGF